MTYVPWAPQIGCKYTLTGAAGTVAVFNDPLDSNYVGMLADITGLDGPEIRESSEDLVEADGGVHGAFYFGRRPIVLTARVFGHVSELEREGRVAKAKRAFNESLRSDATLSWQNIPTASYPSMFTNVRAQSRFIETGGWVKELTISLVSQYAPVFSLAQNSTSVGAGPHTPENKGSYPAFPLIRITGASTNPQISMPGPSPSRIIKTAGLTLAAGETVEIDTLNHTAAFIAGARNGQSANRYIDFTNTTYWPYIDAASSQQFTLAGGGTFQLLWRDTWG